MGAGNIDRPKLLLLDLETLPDFDEILKIWPSVSDYPGRTLKATISSIICTGYKWLDEHKRARCLNAWDYPEWSENKNNDKPLLEKFVEIASKADAIITHNARLFCQSCRSWSRLDRRKLNPRSIK